MEIAVREPDYRLLSVEFGDDGVAHIVLDDPDEPVNTISEALGEEMQRLWPKLQTDPRVRSILISSGKKGSFVAGAKLEMIQGVKTAEEAEKLARFGQSFFDEIARSQKPVVVAIDGAALGGGLELALACTYRLASLAKHTKLGLPETQLGLIPGAGGTQRLPRLIGIAKALELILTGKQLDAERALRRRLVCEAVPEPLLLQVARERARAFGEGKMPGPERKQLFRPLNSEELRSLALEENPIGRRLLFKQARKQALEKSKGHYPAIPAAIEAVQVGMEEGMERGLAKEAELFGQLAVSEVSRQLVRIFFAQTALKKETGVDDPEVKPKEIRNIGMVGAGLMGGGIAYVSSAIAKIPVRFKEKDDEALGRGFAYVRRVLDERVRRKRGWSSRR